MKRDRTLKTARGDALPRVGLGCMGMSEFYGPRDDAGSLRALHLAYDLGYRHFDTADLYGAGHNEELLARFLRDLGPSRRDDVHIATKVGLRRVPGATPRIDVDSSPAYVVGACEASLRRLDATHIDLLYLHRRSPSVPVEDTMAAMSRLVEGGKVRAIGLSEVSPETLRRASAVFPVAALQSEYSLWSRDVEEGVLDACAELGVAFVAYSPLGRGFLSGDLTPADIGQPGDLRQHLPRFAEGNFATNASSLEVLRQAAGELGASMAQTALAWVLSRDPFVYAIPGARRDEHLRTNVAAADLAPSTELLARLSSRFALHSAAGERLPPQLLKTIDA